MLIRVNYFIMLISINYFDMNVWKLSWQNGRDKFLVAKYNLNLFLFPSINLLSQLGNARYIIYILYLYVYASKSFRFQVASKSFAFRIL